MSERSAPEATGQNPAGQQKTKQDLSSLWDGLSPHLIASFYEVGRNGKRIDESTTVRAPLLESSLELTLGWKSPFENSGMESGFPTSAAMLQSGLLGPLVDGADFIGQFEGRTGVTKLNSTQVFDAMQPAKMQVTALFRAWREPKREVEAPFSKLMEWALPVKLAEDGLVLSRLITAVKDGKLNSAGLAEVAMPSRAPTIIAMKYKNRIYSPLVIEAISAPLTSPVDKRGDYVEMALSMTLCTLAAIDRGDWLAMRQWT